jgi:hypothetical protein
VPRHNNNPKTVAFLTALRRRIGQSSVRTTQRRRGELCGFDIRSGPRWFREKSAYQLINDDTNLGAHMPRMGPERIDGETACLDVRKHLD